MFYILIGFLLVSILIFGFAFYQEHKEKEKEKEKVIDNKIPDPITEINFRDTVSAFSYASEYWNHEWKLGRIYVGRLLESTEDTDGNNIYLTLAAAGRSDILAIGDIKHIKCKLRNGNLVYWQLTDTIDNSVDGITKTMPAGVILAILSPSFNVKNQCWHIRNNFIEDKKEEELKNLRDKWNTNFGKK